MPVFIPLIIAIIPLIAKLIDKFIPDQVPDMKTLTKEKEFKTKKKVVNGLNNFHGRMKQRHGYKNEV